MPFLVVGIPHLAERIAHFALLRRGRLVCAHILVGHVAVQVEFGLRHVGRILHHELTPEGDGVRAAGKQDGSVMSSGVFLPFFPNKSSPDGSRRCS